MILLEKLACKGDIFKQEAERKKWMDQLELYRPFIERMLEISLNPPVDLHAFDEKCNVAFKTCRYTPTSKASNLDVENFPHNWFKFKHRL